MFDDIFSPPILEFKGSNHFLSNFHPAEFVWGGMYWTTSEHAYQAAKTLDIDIRIRISELAKPSYAKHAGRVVVLRPDWNDVKEDIMREIVFAKFTQSLTLRQRLLNTGNAHLEEGNNHRDRVWGVYPVGSGIGQNRLGKILMDLRSEMI